MAVHQYSRNEMYSWIRTTSAVVLLLVFICSLTLNSLLLNVLRTKNIFLIKGNRFVGCLATVELLVQVLGLPLVISSMFADRWLFGRFGCVFYAFLMTWLGIMTISLLTVIAIERFLVVFPKHPVFITRRMAIIITSLCTTYGLAWAISPYSGWTEYVFEPSGVSCTPSWAPEYINFVITIFTTCFIVPFTFMTLCYGTILWKVHSMKQTQTISRLSDTELAKTMMLVMGCFLICWLPYAIFAGLGTFGVDMSHVPIEVTCIPLACAKAAGLLHPIIYGLKNSAFRNEMLVTCKRFFLRSDISGVELQAGITANNVEMAGTSTHCELVGIVSKRTEPVDQNVTVASCSNPNAVGVSHVGVNNYSENGNTNKHSMVFSIGAALNQEGPNSSLTETSIPRFTPRPATLKTHSL